MKKIDFSVNRNKFSQLDENMIFQNNLAESAQKNIRKNREIVPFDDTHKILMGNGQNLHENEKL